jgi:hypothetical protein
MGHSACIELLTDLLTISNGTQSQTQVQIACDVGHEQHW